MKIIHFELILVAAIGMAVLYKFPNIEAVISVAALAIAIGHIRGNHS